MDISLIAAMDKNRVIGNHNRLPWHLPQDLHHFKAMTLGKPIIMGRKTFESIGKKPLPGRRNIVISRNLELNAKGCELATSLDEALNKASQAKEVMVIGGANIFAQALPKANRLYLTLIAATLQGDSYFPPLDPDSWQETWRKDHKADSQNPYDYSFVILERQGTLKSL